MLGIDATAENVGIAQAHASKDTSLFLEQTPEYRHTTAEDLAASGATFDVVSALEVLEHVEGPTEFVRTCISLVKVRHPRRTDRVCLLTQRCPQ